MTSTLRLILTIIDIYMFIVIAQVIISWMIVFGVVNTHNPFVASVREFLFRATEPVLRPIRDFMRRLIGDMGGIDISPLILILGMWWVSGLLAEYWPR